MKELIQAIGKKGLIQIGGLNVEVKVLDVKQSYGRDRYLVTPIAGNGEVWIECINLYKTQKKEVE